MPRRPNSPPKHSPFVARKRRGRPKLNTLGPPGEMAVHVEQMRAARVRWHLIIAEVTFKYDVDKSTVWRWLRAYRRDRARFAAVPADVRARFDSAMISVLQHQAELEKGG